MLLALAVLLLQPQIHPQPAPAANISRVSESTPALVAVADSETVFDQSAASSAQEDALTIAATPATAAAAPVPALAASASSSAAAPAAPAPVAADPSTPTQTPLEAGQASVATLPDAPVPVAAGGIHRVKAMVFNVIDPQFESRRDQRMWLALSIAQHTAAGFDAWTTRREISSGQGQELNPFLKPFAGNDSLYVVMQVTPIALDFVAHHMMYSSHSWERHTWWVPQVLGTASSFAAGAHNLTVRATPAP